MVWWALWDVVIGLRIPAKRSHYIRRFAACWCETTVGKTLPSLHLCLITFTIYFSAKWAVTPKSNCLVFVSSNIKSGVFLFQHRNHTTVRPATNTLQKVATWTRTLKLFIKVSHFLRLESPWHRVNLGDGGVMACICLHILFATHSMQYSYIRGFQSPSLIRIYPNMSQLGFLRSCKWSWTSLKLQPRSQLVYAWISLWQIFANPFVKSR